MNTPFSKSLHYIWNLSNVEFLDLPAPLTFILKIRHANYGNLEMYRQTENKMAGKFCDHFLLAF